MLITAGYYVPKASVAIQTRLIRQAHADVGLIGNASFGKGDPNIPHEGSLMTRRAFLAISTAALLAACTTTPSDTPGRLGPDGKPLPKVYRIGPGDRSRIQFRMLDSVNALRKSAGVPELSMNAQLNAAAATHSRDMSVQNRPWLFGSDGSSPIDRVRRVGYRGTYVGEVISESYETELETLAGWMDQEDTRRVILDAEAREMGFAWHQEGSGKIWWTMTLGQPGGAPGPQLTAQAAQAATFQ